MIMTRKSFAKSTATQKVLKALSVFGGVQVLSILCSIIRTKIVALWIGPVGVGLITLYSSTIEFLSTSSQLNLRQSAVRDLSQARDTKNAPRLALIVRRLALLLGSIGTVLTALLSPALSRFTFGTDEHTLAFVLLSPMILLISLAGANWAIMQGFEQLKRLARSTVTANIVATVIAVPLLFFFGTDGVIPTLITYAAANCLFSRLWSVPLPKQQIKLQSVVKEGRGMIALGIYMTISAGVSLLASYIFTAWLNRNSGADVVGIYQSGYTLINSYVGLLFTAISMEYYPRLANVSASKWRCQAMVSHEIKVAMWILMPILAAFIGMRGLAVKILYSSDFYAALPYLGMASIGVIFRAASWCMAYTMLARGDGRTYIVTETISAAAYIVLNIYLWQRWSYVGLGVAYIAWFALYTLVCYVVFRYRYNMRLGRGVALLCAITLAVCATSLALDNYFGSWAPILIAIVTIYPAFKALKH